MKRPQWTKERVTAELAQRGIEPTKAVLLGVRGYFLNSMGAAGTNDRGIYDDAMFLISPSFFGAYNANTDPSRHKTGIAELQCGIYHYRIGKHGINREREQGIPAYTALVQAGAVEVLRDGGKREKGFFGINIHRGGTIGTSSLGCQTIPPEQWNEFISAVQKAMAGQTLIQYVLIETQG